jgi:hypothetical protein
MIPIRMIRYLIDFTILLSIPALKSLITLFKYFVKWDNPATKIAKTKPKVRAQNPSGFLKPREITIFEKN